MGTEDLPEPGAVDGEVFVAPVRGPALPARWGTREVWETFFEEAPMPYCLFELEAQRSMFNRRGAALFGYEYRPGEWFDVRRGAVGPEAQKARTAGISQVYAERLTEVEYHRRFVRLDGTTFVGHVVGSVLTDDDDRPWALLLAMTDVSARVEAEKALVQSESRFRSLVQNSYDPIIVLDGSGNLKYASPAAARVFGAPIEPLIGDNMFELVHPDDRPFAAEALMAVLMNPGKSDPLRLRMVRPDGSLRLLELLPTNLLDDPAVEGVVVNVHDVTDAEEFSSALEMTENRFRRMLENISDTVTLVDRDGRVILTTGNLRPVMGYSVQFWEARDAFELVHPDDIDEARRTYQRLIEHPARELSTELRMRTADGRYIDVEVNGVNLLGDPDVAAVVLTSRDVTARKKAERDLADARDQAVRALRTRTEFIASVSHELRTPIHGILGLSELLATTDLDPDARNLARSIGRATESLRMVLDDILDFSKIEVGRLDINHGPISVREMADDIDALFRPQAQAKGICLRADLEEGFPEVVLGDALRVRQVLQNLIGNAVKFTAEGRVVVTLRRLPVDDGRQPYLWLSVKDTGIGIPADGHGRLFEPFSQVHRSTRELGGTGLGLSIAKRLVELMGGELGFRSDPGQGSEFWFTLPLTEGAGLTSVADDRLGHVPASTGGRVLVVEDNAINQLLVRRQLERLGYEAIVVESGQAALDAFPQLTVDLVLMDWQLPGIDGLETTRRLRAWECVEDRRPTPVVAMTASALPGDRDRCLAAGMDDFVAKPVGIAVLGAMVRRWIPEAGRPVGPAGPGPAAPAVVAPAGSPGVGDVPRSPAAEAPVVPPISPILPPISPVLPLPDAPVPVAAVGREAPIVDVSLLDGLKDELADTNLVATVVRTYLRELPGRIEGFVAVTNAGDVRGISRLAHTLRSTSAAVGAIELARLCAAIERTVQAGLPVALDADQLRVLAGAVAASLGDYLERLTVTPGAPAPPSS